MIERKIKGNPEAEELVCKLHTQGYSTYKIAKLMKEAGLPVDQKTVWHFLNNPTTKDIVLKHRQKYLSDPEAIGIFHKTVRLEDLNRERIRIVNTIKKLCGTNEDIPLKVLSKYLNLSKRLIDIEIAGREEVERRPDLIALFQRIGPYSEVSDAELLRERGLVEQKLLIIRRGEDPVAKKDTDRQGTDSSTEEKSS
jgi:hypothetical protein